MYKESLFELIRKEEVVIWAGAGLSLYAGFPSGQDIADILLKNLTEPEKISINNNQTLPDLAEDFYRLKGNNRNSLIRILKETFSNLKPKSTECHNNLAIIPHFKTIITTNYDTLLEDAFAQKAQVILSSKHIPYLERDKTHIFKVHGDFSEPDSIVITKSDYNNFFKKNSEDDIYWTVIKERLSTKSVLFLGYNLEDPNVSVIFNKITDALGTNRKESFLVAPNLPQHKINDLVKKGIHYINLTAEQLILDLIQNLKENIIEDLQKGCTSADTFRNFLSNIDLLPELKADNTSYKLHSIHSINAVLEGRMNFSIKNEPDFIEEFNKFISGNKKGTFKITEDKLIKADLWYGGLKYPSLEGASLELKSVPRVSTVIDIRFEDGTEFNDVPVKIYGSFPEVDIYIKLKNAIIDLTVNVKNHPETTVKFHYAHDEICQNVKDELDLYKLLTNLGEGIGFIIFSKTGQTYTYPFPKLDALLEESKTFLYYFQNLKLIEQHYKIRFTNFRLDSINETTIENTLLITSAIKGESIDYNWNEELTFELFDDSDEAINQFMTTDKENLSIIGHQNSRDIKELHGQNIDLGFKTIEFLDTQVVNLESVLAKEERVVRIRSNINRMRVSYSISNKASELNRNS